MYYSKLSGDLAGCLLILISQPFKVAIFPTCLSMENVWARALSCWMWIVCFASAAGHFFIVTGKFFSNITAMCSFAPTVMPFVSSIPFVLFLLVWTASFWTTKGQMPSKPFDHLLLLWLKLSLATAAMNIIFVVKFLFLHFLSGSGLSLCRQCFFSILSMWNHFLSMWTTSIMLSSLPVSASTCSGVNSICWSLWWSSDQGLMWLIVLLKLSLCLQRRKCIGNGGIFIAQARSQIVLLNVNDTLTTLFKSPTVCLVFHPHLWVSHLSSSTRRRAKKLSFKKNTHSTHTKKKTLAVTAHKC